MTTAASAEPASAAATAPHLRHCSSVTAGAAAAINGVNESSGATGASTRCTRSAPASRMIAHPTKTAAAAREMNFISPRSILVPSKHYGPCKHNRHIDSDLGMTPTLQRCIDLRSEEHTSELQSRPHLVCRLLLEKKKLKKSMYYFVNKKKNKTEI